MLLQELMQLLCVLQIPWAQGLAAGADTATAGCCWVGCADLLDEELPHTVLNSRSDG